MKRRFTLITAALMLLAFLANPLGMLGQTETLNIATYASANSWVNGTAYTTCSTTHVTFTGLDNGNNSKYYSNNESWRHYENDNGTITVAAASGYTLSSITFTYANGNSGIIKDGETTVDSGSAYSLSGTSKTFSVGHSSGTKKGNVQITAISVTISSSGGGSTPVVTTTTINATGITNTDVYTSTNAGLLSATVTYDNSGTPTAVPSATVSWESSDTDVATIDSDGNVTLVAAGTTTITASYAGNSDYSASSDTYELTVTNSDPSIVTIWSEDFSSYSADDVPSGGTYSYVCTDGGSTTKVYEDAYAGGSSPELLVSKSNGAFSATIPLLTPTYGYSGALTLTFKANNTNVAVSTITDGVTITGSVVAGTSTLTLSGVTTLTANVVITFTNSESSNVRIDDIVLKGLQAPLTKVATPTISPAGGTVVSGTEVTMTCLTDGATIYYTTDNTPPTSSSTAYNPASKPTITCACTIKAIGIKDGLTNSEVASATYSIAEPCATPTFSPAAGEVAKGTPVEISTTTPEATIYYTTDGTDPTTSSTVYSSAITINSAVTLKAIAAKEGNANSAVASAAYTVIDYATLPFVWAGGTATELTALTGVTGNSLGDYAVQNAPYQVQMNSTSDFIQIKTDSKPSMVTVGVKMVGGATTSKIKVQESSDGSLFTDVEELTIEGNQGDVLTLTTSNSFAATTRYVKIIKSVHASGGNIGVGPIVIYKTTEIAPNTTWTPGDFSPVANNVYVISNDNTLTLNGDFSSIFNDPKILVIEDGAQLIHTNDVSATMKKNITGYGGAKGGSHWYTIASPVDDEPVSTLTTGTYDLYAYTESTHTWYNQKAHTGDFTTLSRGTGYLYANSAAKVIDFAGSMKATNAEVTVPLSYTDALPVLKGVNLVGNPFTRNLTAGEVKIDGTTLTTYLAVEVGSELVVRNISTTPIKPGQGFFVQLPESHTTTNLVFNPSSKGETDTKPAFVCIEAGDANFMDRAYVQIGQGNKLNKVSINEEVSHLYVTNKGKDFAAVTIENAQGEMPVCFKAAYDGNYSISVSTVGLDLNYLHLIDKLTGNDIDLLMTPSYTFEAKKGDNENRFRLVFEANGNALVTSNEPFAYFNGSEWVIENDGNATLQVIDVMGHMLRSENVSGNATTSLPNLSAGVYVLRLVNSESIKTQKVVIE